MSSWLSGDALTWLTNCFAALGVHQRVAGARALFGSGVGGDGGFVSWWPLTGGGGGAYTERETENADECGHDHATLKQKRVLGSVYICIR